MINYSVSDSYILSFKEDYVLAINIQEDDENIYRFSGECMEVLKLISEAKPTSFIKKQLLSNSKKNESEIENFFKTYINDLNHLGIII